MFSNNKIIDEKIFLIVIAVGTLIIYLITPTPNILYKEEAGNSKNIINFGENTSCYGVKTTEVECPLETKMESDSPLKINEVDKPHNLNMNITSVDTSNENLEVDKE